MLKSKFFVLLTVIFLAAFAPTASAIEYGVGANLSTVGPGLEFNAKINPIWNFRFLLQGLPQTDTIHGDIGNALAADFYVSMFSVGPMIDISPWENGFRFTAGLFYVNNRVGFDGEADPDQTYTIGDNTYTGSQVGSYDGRIKYNAIQPYLGLGFDASFTKNKHWWIGIDLGVYYQGKSDVDLNVSNSAVSPSDLAIQESDIEKDADKFSLYPRLAIALKYSF